MLHHPDKGGDPEAFKKITDAYLVLRDPAKREAYDTNGMIDLGTFSNAIQLITEVYLRMVNGGFNHSVPVVYPKEIIKQFLAHSN